MRDYVQAGYNIHWIDSGCDRLDKDLIRVWLWYLEVLDKFVGRAYTFHDNTFHCRHFIPMFYSFISDFVELQSRTTDRVTLLICVQRPHYDHRHNSNVEGHLSRCILGRHDHVDNQKLFLSLNMQ